MTVFRDRLRRWVWLSLLAVAAMALGPTVSRALLPTALTKAHVATVAVDGGDAHHMMRMAPTSDDTKPLAAHHHGGGPVGALDCCELCTVAASPVLVMALVLLGLPSQISAATVPAAAEHPAPACQPTWSPSAARAPPQLVAAD